jgi:hypothetical protein
MTTGILGDSTASWQGTTYDVPLRYTKVWSGGDGRSEVYAGGFRDKWNTYDSRIDSRFIIQKDLVRVRNNGSTSTTALSIPGRMMDVGSYPLSSAEVNRLLDRMVQRVKGHSFNLGVNLGEMSKTVSMFSQTLDSLGRSIAAVKRGNFLGAVSALGIASSKRRAFKSKDVSGRWLELQYGWLPALSEAYEAGKAFEALSKGPRASLFVESFSKRISRTNAPQSDGLVTYYLAGSRIRRLEFELYEEMSVYRQLGLLDPLSVLWELTPYSFVVDWAYPMGTYLSNLNQVPNLNGRWLVTDVTKWPLQEATYSFTPQAGTGSTLFKSVAKYPRVAWRSTHVVRSLGAPLIPRPGFDFRGAIHGKRFWNAIALAHQRFRG